MRNPLHLAILFIILVGSDLIIGFSSHYIGTSDEISIESFMEYLTLLDYREFAIVIAIALIVCAIVFLLSGG